MRDRIRLAYKREVGRSDTLEKAVVSFLNCNSGGEILVGVADDGSAHGVADLDGDQRGIADRLANNIRPKILGLFDVVADRMDGRDIIRVIVSSGRQKPYYLRNKGMTEDGCFIRVGSSAQPMTEAMIESLLAQRQTTSLSTMNVSRQNLTFEQLRIYYSEHKLALGEHFAENLDMRTDDGKYNFLAYLLADSNGASIKVAKYSGTNKIDLVENEEYGYRCLITAVYRVLDKLEVENRTFAKIAPRHRLERKLFDKQALHEAFINAVVRNDYGRGWPLVEFFSDRVTITSTGGLVEGFSEEDFFNGLTMPRNRELMRVFKDVELVEMLGSDMERILRACDRSVFRITPNFVIATFPYEKDFERDAVEDGAEEGMGIERALSEVLNEAEMSRIMPIIDRIIDRGAITPNEARVATGKSETTVWRYLDMLCERGVLEASGNTNAKSYRLAPVMKEKMKEV